MSRRGPRRSKRLPFLAPLVVILALGSSLFLLTVPAAHASAGAGGGQGASAGAPRPQQGSAALSGATGTPATDINLMRSFQGLQYGTNGGLFDSYSPPDVQVASGPTEVVEMANVDEQIFTKTGTSIAVVPLSNIFNTGSDDIGDPRLVYDNSSGLFFASVFDFTTQGVQIAVTKSSSADGGWYYYSITNANDPTLSAANVCVDQPFIGVSTDKVVVTGNDYYAAGPGSCRPLGNFAYQEVWVINKAEMVSGGYINWYYWYYPFSSYGYGSMRPVTTPTSTAYVVCTTCGNGILLEEYNGVPNPGSPPTQTQFTVPFVTPTPPPAAPHLGNTDLLDTDGDVRVWSTAWMNGIWIAMNDGCVPGGDNALRSCAHLVQISVTANLVTVDQDIYGPPGYYLFYPAVTADSFGGIGLVIGYSSPSVYPSVLVTGMKAGETAGSLESNLVTVTNGTGYACHYVRSSGLCRYGDYFGASADPTDPSLMWFGGQYETSAGWATSVTAVRVGFAAVTLSYSTQDGSTPAGSTSVSYVQSGSAKSGTLSPTPGTYYMDLGSTWSVGGQTGGTSTERWASLGTLGGTVTGDLANSIVYYHQYLITPTYTVVGGGSGYGAPGITCSQFGSSVTATSGSQMWADAGSSCSFDQTLQGSTSTERWIQTSSTVTVGGAGAVSETYDHQYYLTVSVTPSQGGSQSLTSGWQDAGMTVSLSATASRGWQFESWSGTGSGAYSGSSADTTFSMNGPVSEVADFYPGLTISASGSGSVQYSFGSTQGAVQPGGSTTVYAPVGTTVTLTPSPSSFFYTFSGWGGGLSGGTSPGQFQLNGASNVSASFGLNFTVVGALVGVAAAAVVGVFVALRRRGGSGSIPPPPPGW
ncbi:MAG: hypothetical protein KGI38_02825 [Thaumarchaeota archaeon]|nr:hypothetical protein [Nitrososphaerota archaeon]